MNESHEHARQLIRVAPVEGISTADREWLDRHLADCPACSYEAQAVIAAIQTMRTFPVTVSPDVVRRTQQLVRNRARQREEQRAHAMPLWIAAVLSVSLMIATTPYVWGSLAWLSQVTRTPLVVWQLAFSMWWFMPVTVFGVAAAWSQENGRRIWL